MSSLTNSFIFLYILLIFVATPLGNGLNLNGLNIGQIKIEGLVTCSATGNPSAAGSLVGAAGVAVSGECNGVSGTIGQAVTNTTGFFSILITAVDGILFVPGQGLPCYVVIRLPVTGTNCKVFLPTGVLRAPVSLIGTVQGLLGGILAIFGTGPFQLLA